MQSYNDLNNFGSTPVNYASNTDYVIVFGANGGNVSIERFENTYFALTQQISLTTFSTVSRDLLITITNNDPNRARAPVYTGSNPNIQVYESNLANYVITGIRTVADYNDVFANTVLGIGSGLDPIVFTVLIDDQRGTTRTYNITVQPLLNLVLTYNNPLPFAEDTLAPLGAFAGGANLQITDVLFTTPTNYTIAIQPTLGQIYNSTTSALANSFSMTNSKANINSAIQSLSFAPAADSVTNTTIGVTVTRVVDGLIVPAVIDAAFNGIGHSDYELPLSYSLPEDSQLSMGNIRISDIRPDNINANIQYRVELNTVDSANINFVYGNVQMNSVVLTGTKPTINNILGNVNLQPRLRAYNNFTGNGVITYSQVNTTDSSVQANQVPVQVFVSLDPGYLLQTGYVLPVTNSASSGNTRLVWSITEDTGTDPFYRIDFRRLTGPTGNFVVNGVDTGTQPGNISGNRSVINAQTINFVTTVANTANATLQWAATRYDNPFGTGPGNPLPASGNITLTLETAITNLKPFYPYTSNVNTAIFSGSNKPNLSTAMVGNIELIIDSGSGSFATNRANFGNSLSLVGSRNQIDSLLSTIQFYPNFRQAGNVTANLKIRSAANVTFVDRTLTLAGTRANVPPSLYNISPLNIPAGVYQSDINRTLYCNIGNIVLSAGGGGGGTGGGGAGTLSEFSNTNFEISKTYAVVIGAGGAAANASTTGGQPGGFTFMTDFGGSGGGGFGGVRLANVDLCVGGNAGDAFGFGFGGAGGTGNVNDGGTIRRVRGGGGGGSFNGIAGNGQAANVGGRGGAGTVIQGLTFGAGGNSGWEGAGRPPYTSRAGEGGDGSYTGTANTTQDGQSGAVLVWFVPKV
jgi:hypothetical protein